ncbi:bifunctional UDP-sugar hydrolase/5'-nucleotidase [Novipirellula rosea]
MKTLKSLILSLLLAGLSCSMSEAEEKQKVISPAEVTILHTCDFHGRHMPFRVVSEDATSQTGNPQKPENRFGKEGRIGGFEALASAVERVRQKQGEQNVLLVHAGDTFSDDLLGNLTQGEAVIRMMNAVGYDYMALGNHDFDYGVEQTRHLQKLADFPLRGANIIEQKTNQLFLGKPFHIFSMGKVKIAVLALGYHNTDQTTAPKNIQGLRFVNGIETARRYVPELRRQADVVVILSHQGTAVDKLLAREVDGIDLIIGGHSHDRLHPAITVNGTKIVQAMSDTAALGEVRVSLVAGQVVKIEDELHMLWAKDYSHPKMATLIADIRQPHRQKLEEVIGIAKTRIPRKYKHESPFDVLVAELLRQETGAEVALLPGVGYGITLPQGEVTREDLYTLLPHPAKLATFTLTGQQIHDVLEQSATNQEAENPLDRVGGLIQTSGMTWTLDWAAQQGKRVRDVQVNAVQLDRNKSYRVASHSGMLNGIHRYDELRDAEEVKVSEESIVDIVERHFQRSESIVAPQPTNITLIPKPR